MPGEVPNRGGKMTINVDLNTVSVFLASTSVFFTAAAAAIRTAIAFVVEITPLLKPVIEDAENRAKDRLIDLADRKAIAMNGIRALEKSGKLRLNPITRFVVSKVVDDVAKLLPDFKFNDEGKGIQ